MKALQILSSLCCSRRQFLQSTIGVGLVFVTGCERRYVRPDGLHDLGEVKDILYATQFLRDRALLVTRDNAGWSVMSTRCTMDGCEMSYQERSFLCLCCQSVFTHTGDVVRGPAKYPLPYFALRYEANHLYALSGEVVDASYRFTTDEIERVIAQLREHIRTESVRPGARIPEILLGQGDGESGTMFEETAEPVITPR